MTIQNKATLKSYFDTDDIPSSAQFVDLIDSMSPRLATLFVAASNATDGEKANADYVCDGTGDEIEINAAIQALPAEGGGIVTSSGLFSVSEPILFTKKFNFHGQGSGLATAGVGITTIQGTGAFDVLQVSMGSGKVQGCAMSNFSILGSASNNGYAGIYTDWTDLLNMTNISIERCQYGYHAYRNDAGVCIGISTQGCGLGFYLDTCGNIRLDNCCSADNDGDETLLASHAYITACSKPIISNSLFDLGGKNGIVIGGYTGGLQFENNKVNKSDLNGILIGDTSGHGADINIFIGNNISDNGQLGTAGSAEGLKIASGRYSVINGNLFMNTPSINTTQQNGIVEIVGWTDYSNVSGNIFLGNTSTGFVKIGANSLDVNNIVC